MEFFSIQNIQKGFCSCDSDDDSDADKAYDGETGTGGSIQGLISEGWLFLVN